jgi:uncharacterized membrane protein
MALTLALSAVEGIAHPWALLLWPPLVALVAWLAWRRFSLSRRERAGVRGSRRRGSFRERDQRWWPVVVMRVLLVTLLVLGLANPGGQAAASTARLVVLVDGSASVDAQALAQIRRALTASPQTLVVQFAEGQTMILDTNGEWPPAPGGEKATDIESALNFAGQLLAGGRGSILLISDGEATRGAALRAARALADSQIRVDVLPFAAPRPTPDVGVESVLAPQAMWAGDDIPLTVNLYSASAVTATVRLWRDDHILAAREIALPEGATTFGFASPADVPGLSIFRAEVDAPGDAVPQNNAASAVVAVEPAPKVLIAAHHPEAGALLRDALSLTGLEAAVVAPSELPIADLHSQYQVLILEDVSADSLNVEQWAAVRAFTQIHGRGLIVVGGRSSYSLGGYEATPLEAMLPVKLAPPRRTERPPATLLLVIDNSGSMAPANTFGPAKIDLAKEAAMRAVEILQPNDRVGVMGFSDRYYWAVPLGALGQGLALRDVLDRINTMTARGNTNMLTPLQVGIRELAAQTTARKHLVLLSDGETYQGNAADFERAVAEARAAGVTVSTIALGNRGDPWQQLMASIAEWGQGRYHFAASAEDIPRLMLAESRSVNSDPIQRGRTQSLVSRHPIVRGFVGTDLPPIEGYLALTPRPEADTVLTTGSFGDPLLAVWQYGLGRVAAWTSDVGGREAWTGDWPGWGGFPRFWTQIARYVLPDPAQKSVFASATISARAVSVSVLAVGEDGQGINLARGQLLFRTPDGQIARVDLPQTSPGEYAATFTAPQPGAYRALATLEKDGQHWEAPLGFVVGYSPEFSPRRADGASLLAQIAESTGGRVLSDVRQARVPRASVLDMAGYGPWLILAALILWPVDIAIRRRWRPWPEK